MTEFYIATFNDTPEGGPMRLNGGEMIIMEGYLDDEGEEDRRPVLHVMRRARAKRGQAWNTPDPEQEAFAARVVALLNAG